MMMMTAENMPKVRVRYDEMEAYLFIPTPDSEDENYTIENLHQALAEGGVRSGINEEVLSEMISKRIYGQERLVALGVAAVDGIDGYYEYNFNPNPEKKPQILPDGSVDYWSVNSIEEVTEGQVIATYFPAVPGKDGMNVKGQVLQARRGRDLQALKGKGFSYSDETKTYTASFDGKIEMQNGRVLIQQVHEVHGNVDLSMGNIDFRGDVVIHGSVESGISIKASGSITIDGAVEACVLEAGKDVIIRDGMQGGNKAMVKTKGSITARFFEYTWIECEGTLQTDVLLDCNVRCKSRIIVSGNKGKIIGGDIRAVEGVEVFSLGNDAEKRTEVTAGAEADICKRLYELEEKIQTTQENLAKIEMGLEKFARAEAEQGVSYANDPRRMSLLRVKIKDTATLANDEGEAKKLRLLVERSKGATVTVLHYVYPGVFIYIDNMRFKVNNMAQEIEFYKRQDKIATRPYYGNA